MVDFSRRELLAALAASAAVKCGPVAPDSVADRAREDAMPGSPILLSAGCSINPGTQGAPNTAALVAPYGLPMEIHEIKFSIYDSAGASCVGGTVGCDLKLGDIELTNGYVPVCLFSKFQGAGFLSSPVERDDTEVLTKPIAAATASQYVWRLPRPLFVPGGAVLAPVFEHRALVNSPHTVRIDYSGYVLPRGYRPRQLVAPWVTYYAPNGMEGATASSVASLETDLANKFDVPVHLQRMIARIYAFQTATSVLSASYGTTYWGKLLQMRMDHSNGVRIIPDLSMFASVFWPDRFTLEIGGTELPARSYFQVYLDLTAGVLPGELLFPMMSLIGWREVA